MDNNRFENDTSLRGTLDGFIRSYAQRDTGMAFPDWLADRLRQELPELKPDASVRLVEDITKAVAGYDQTLRDLNQAVESGQSKEEWFSEQLARVYEDMPPDAAGESLQRMEAELVSSNMRLMGEIEPAQTGEIITADGETAPTEWNKYSLKAKANSIGQQLNSIALTAVAGAMNRNLNGDNTAISEVITDAFQTGLRSSPEEVKAVVAGAVRASAERGLIDALSADTPIEVIGDLAGAAVEGAEALCDAASGNITMTEALDKVGRAGVAAGCRAGAGVLRKSIASLPGGPVLTDLLGGLIDHVASSKFINNVYTAVRGAAVATWEGLKQSKIVNGLKRLGRKLFG